jgi:hypothetical protein
VKAFIVGNSKMVFFKVESYQIRQLMLIFVPDMTIPYQETLLESTYAPGGQLMWVFSHTAAATAALTQQSSQSFSH